MEKKIFGPGRRRTEKEEENICGERKYSVQRERQKEKKNKKEKGGKLDPVGSTVRYEMMNLCTVSV